MPGLWLPPKTIKYRCLVPGCGEGFGPDERRKWIQHTVACAGKTDFYERQAEHRDSNYFTGIADTEQFEYLRKQAAGVHRVKPMTVPRTIPKETTNA